MRTPAPRYPNFMEDTQNIEIAVRALAPKWGDYPRKSREDLRKTLYQLDRIALMIEQLTKQVERDIAND